MSKGSEAAAGALLAEIVAGAVIVVVLAVMGAVHLGRMVALSPRSLPVLGAAISFVVLLVALLSGHVLFAVWVILGVALAAVIVAARSQSSDDDWFVFMPPSFPRWPR